MCLALPRGRRGYGSTSGRGGERLACFYQGLPLRQRDFRASRRLSRLVFPEANQEGERAGASCARAGPCVRSSTGDRRGFPSFVPLNVGFDPPSPWALGSHLNFTSRKRVPSKQSEPLPACPKRVTCCAEDPEESSS